MRAGLLTVTLATALVAGSASATKLELKPGKARWAIKTSVPHGVSLDSPVRIKFEDLVRLPDPPHAAKDNRDFQATRYPPAPGIPPEGTIVETEGWLQLVALEKDGDYHIQISARPEDGNNCVIVEVPKDSPAFERDPELAARAAVVREKLRTAMGISHEPSDRGELVKRRVRVAGQLFFDDAHFGDPNPRGKHGMKAATLWEIHPVTAIDVFMVMTNYGR